MIDPIDVFDQHLRIDTSSASPGDLLNWAIGTVSFSFSSDEGLPQDSLSFLVGPRLSHFHSAIAMVVITGVNFYPPEANIAPPGLEWRVIMSAGEVVHDQLLDLDGAGFTFPTRAPSPDPAWVAAWYGAWALVTDEDPTVSAPSPFNWGIQNAVVEFDGVEHRARLTINLFGSGFDSLVGLDLPTGMDPLLHHTGVELNQLSYQVLIRGNIAPLPEQGGPLPPGYDWARRETG